MNNRVPACLVDTDLVLGVNRAIKIGELSNGGISNATTMSAWNNRVLYTNKRITLIYSRANDLLYALCTQEYKCPTHTPSTGSNTAHSSHTHTAQVATQHTAHTHTQHKVATQHTAHTHTQHR